MEILRQKNQINSIAVDVYILIEFSTFLHCILHTCKRFVAIGYSRELEGKLLTIFVITR